jgi:hypothetical protein
MPRAGGPRTVADERVLEVVTKTLERKPANATHWSTRTMAKESGLPQSTVSRIWRALGLQTHRSESFKLSTDPYFVDSCTTWWVSTWTRRSGPWCSGR